MATTTSLTTELEAVNTILEAAGEAPVADLSLSGLLPLTQARATLDRMSRTVQSHGWAFNTEYDHELTPGVGGLIALPSNTLSFDANDEYNWKVRPQQRGLSLYDAKNRTAVFTEPVKGKLVVLLEWASLPQAARNYIMVRAARVFQAASLTSDARERFTQADEAEALIAMGDFETETADANFINDSYESLLIMGLGYR